VIERSTGGPLPASGPSGPPGDHPPRGVRTVPARIDDLGGGRFRITPTTTPGFSVVASAATPGDLARALSSVFTEAQVAAYAAWRGARYDLDGLTSVDPDDETGLAPRRRRPRRPARRSGTGWARGQDRPDVHPPERWQPNPDGSFTSPSGRNYGPDTGQARRARTRLGLPDPRS
jgi:hypothetical protein